MPHDSEVAHALGYATSFIEQFSNYQVLALSFPLEELEVFFRELETVLALIKSKTGYLFAPVIFQRSLFCPDSEYMVVLHKASQIDSKLPNVCNYSTPKELASAFSIQVYDPYFCPD